jgi:membrane dipeptidase
VSVHEDAVVIDGTCPGAYFKEHWRDWLHGGASCCVVSVTSIESARETVSLLGQWHRFVEERPELLLAETVDDVHRAKREGRLGVMLHLQGTHPFEYETDLLVVYQRAGVRIVQMAYNHRSPAADGCEEPGNAGLSRFGEKLIRELNRRGVVVDLTHTGIRSSLEAIELSAKPCIFSHANARAVHDSPRNLTDEQIRAVAERGGVVGMVGFPSFVSSASAPSLDDYVAHIDHVASLVGARHVAIGLDYYQTDRRTYDHLVEIGQWSPENYAPPPWSYPAGLERPSGLPRLTECLLDRGYAADAVVGILGENLLRVYAEAASA